MNVEGLNYFIQQMTLLIPTDLPKDTRIEMYKERLYKVDLVKSLADSQSERNKVGMLESKIVSELKSLGVDV